MWIKKFSNCLTGMQLKLSDKKSKQRILKEVKRKKFLKYLPQYIQATLIPQIKEDWRYEYLIQQGESYAISKRYIAVSKTIRTVIPCQRSSKPYNPGRNRLKNRRQQRKTGFNPRYNNLSNQPAKGNSSNNFD